MSASNGAAPPTVTFRALTGAASRAMPGRAFVPPPPPKTRRSRLLVVVAVGFGGWMLGAGTELLAAHRAAQQGSRQVAAVSASLAGSTMVDGQTAHLLEGASHRFRAAHRRASGPVLLPVRFLPVAGRQVRSFAALAASASEVSAIAAEAASRAEDVLGRAKAAGDGRAEALRRLATVAADARMALAGVELGHSPHLIAPLTRRWVELGGQVNEAERWLDRAETVLSGVSGFLVGPRRYLVLAANNAEMRAGSGMFLSAGVLEVRGGDLTLGPMRPTGRLTLPRPGVPLEGDLADRWGWLQPGREWRNLATTPRFDAIAPVAVRMWAQLTGVSVDGVLAVDVELLRAVLTATGPVVMGDRSVEHTSVVDRILYDQYQDADATDPLQVERRDELGEVARSVVEELERGELELRPLVAELTRAARGRHLLAWSSLEEDHRAWDVAGLTGSLRPDSLTVNVLNRGGNKLDQFLRVGAILEARPSPSSADFVLTVHLRNRTPPGLPRYVAGPHPDADVGAGDYLGILAVNVPGAASAISVEGGAGLVAAGRDGPTNVIAVRVLVPRGGEQSVVITFRLPPLERTMTVVPSARLPAISWTMDGASWTDDSPRTLSWPAAA